MNELITTESVPLSKPFEIEISGVNMRDWFAGMALQGMLCNGFMPSAWSGKGGANAYNYTAAAYAAADDMLKARKGKKDE